MNKPSVTTDEPLTKKEAAVILQVSERQIQRWVADRKLKAHRLSHKVLRFRRQDIERFMDRSTT